MLTKDEERTIEQILLEFVRSGRARAAEADSLLSRLPDKPEARAHLFELARRRGLPWIEALAGDPPAPPAPLEALAALLATEESYPRKVEALLAATKAPPAGFPDLLRKRLAAEPDPFVLATLASCLGHCGAAGDEPALRALIAHADPRVQANALDALRRLGLPVAEPDLAATLDSPDNRVRIGALGLLALSDGSRALDLIAGQSMSPDPARRAALGFLLGELTAEPRAGDLLLAMMAQEQHMLVLKPLAQGLRRHVTAANATPLLERLAALVEVAQGAKLSLLRTLLQQLRAGLGQATGPAPAPDPLVEEDEELSFSGTWGRPQPVAPREPARPLSKVPPPPAPSRAGLGWLAGVLAGFAIVGGIVWTRPAAPAGPAPHASSSRARPRTALAAAASKAPHAAPTPGAPAAPGTAPVPRHFGSVGAPVDVQGTLLGATRSGPVVTSAGRNYLVVKGPAPADPRKGEPYHLVGTLLGRSPEGLYYVESSGRD